MDSTDEEFYGGSTIFTTKGQRTKRQRTAATTSAYAGGSGGAYPENSYGSSASATPDNQDAVSEVTAEEQDLANCLILLAQGPQKGSCSKIIISSNYINKKNSTNSSVTGVYECKTCNRTFPSFQALGGHRTSHKKTVVKPSILPSSPLPPKSEVEEQPRDGGISHDSSPVPAPRKPAPNRPNQEKSRRVHECSICGSEFPSGQALGGHMRRHRPAAAAPHGRQQVMTAEIIELVLPRNNNNFLALDLNLPAPSDDDDVETIGDDDHDHGDDNSSHHMVETKFHVLSTPALLDCHY
ncbi:hypothetical protein vseg_015352 [Gypsophila vaccaria]